MNKKVTSDVPQGSISGPFIFASFINDISSVVSNTMNITMYDDDTKIWRAQGDNENLQQGINYLNILLTGQILKELNSIQINVKNFQSGKRHLQICFLKK